ncbi:MAG: hypothetical protein KGH54_03485 [Candidatus Micrarchaeota archaeon]|nr:hypothetical protein [Candidatus Micrarchaeota archaeon]
MLNSGRTKVSRAGDLEACDAIQLNKEIQDTMDRLIALTNSPTGYMRQYALVFGKMSKLISQIEPLRAGAECENKMSEWERRVFGVFIKKLSERGSGIVEGEVLPLGAVMKEVDYRYGIGLSAANLCMDLLARRGLVEDLSKKRFYELIRMDGRAEEPQVPSGFATVLTRVGAHYAKALVSKGSLP